MAAAVLILLVCVELAVSVWCVTRFRGVLKEVALVEKSLDALTGVIRNWTVDERPVELPVVDDAAVSAAKDTLAGASKEQLDAAAKLLDSLGLNKDSE